MVAKTVIEVVALIPPHGGIPLFFVSADVDAKDGVGTFVLTNDPQKAMLFDDTMQAIEYQRRVSTVRPVRDDGKPNRPMTALSVGFQRIEVE